MHFNEGTHNQWKLCDRKGKKEDLPGRLCLRHENVKLYTLFKTGRTLKIIPWLAEHWGLWGRSTRCCDHQNGCKETSGTSPYRKYMRVPTPPPPQPHGWGLCIYSGVAWLPHSDRPGFFRINAFCVASAGVRNKLSLRLFSGYFLQGYSEFRWFSSGFSHILHFPGSNTYQRSSTG